ncbi:MAG: AAA domain-containing protein [Deltaproteobacteria bacterium]|nr:AAA domain-containing protein [Deltaproteobacteria bacterium]
MSLGSDNPGFPFSAIVNQETLKNALLLCLVHPGLKGVVIRGERGTGKSTVARALTKLMPVQQAIKGCPYGCDPDDPASACESCIGLLKSGQDIEIVQRPMPFVNLPVGCTEDRITGDIDLTSAIKEGKRRYRPGLLAEANRGILYIDEVNLLPDHIVDLLLDVAAFGTNIVEREGVRNAHPSRLILIGTMNPEEGDLRPQLTDRFDLSVEVSAADRHDQRVEVLRRILDFERDPSKFCSLWTDQEKRLSDSIVMARKMISDIKPSNAILEKAARLSEELGVDGHRAEIAAVKAACGLAALAGRTKVEDEHLFAAAELAYPHRLRKSPFDDSPQALGQVRQTIERMKQRPASDLESPVSFSEKKK